MKEYKSREYCRDTECTVQMIRDAGGTPFSNCKNCEAYQFHQWLQDNGYKIVKEGE